MSEEESGSYISAGPLLMGVVVGAGLGTLICKIGGLNYACLMKKITNMFCTTPKKKCGAAAATAGVVAADKPVDDAPKKPCKQKAA